MRRELSENIRIGASIVAASVVVTLLVLLAEVVIGIDQAVGRSGSSSASKTE